MKKESGDERLGGGVHVMGSFAVLTCSSSLDFFDAFDIAVGLWIPDWARVF